MTTPNTDLRQKIVGSLSRSNMQEAGSRVSEIVIEKEADKILKEVEEELLKAEGEAIATFLNDLEVAAMKAKELDALEYIVGFIETKSKALQQTKRKIVE